MRTDRPNHCQRWTSEQIAKLIRLARQDLTAQEIAAQIGRTHEAVQVKARQHGLSLVKAAPFRRRRKLAGISVARAQVMTAKGPKPLR